MKTLKLYLIALFLIVLGSSCEQEDFTGKAKIEPVSGITASVDASDVAGTYLESDEDTIRVTVTLSDLQTTADVVVHAIQTGGDAVLGEDAEFINEDGFGVTRKVIPAGSGVTSVTWTLVILDDCMAESTETLELQFGDERTANVSIDPVSASLSIANYRSFAPSITMEWGTSVDGEDLSVGGLDVADIDMDILLLNDQGADVGNYSAATGANPEELVFTAADGTELPDGTYFLLVDMYASFEVGGDIDPVEFPIFFNFSRCGASLNTDAVLTGFDSNGYFFDGAYQSGILAYQVTKQGDDITVNDGTVDIASGEIEAIKSQINK